MYEDTNKASEETPLDDAVNQTMQAFSAEENEALRIYFERQGQELLNSWKKELTPRDDLPHYLLRYLKTTKKFYTRIELPWSEFIPILYKALTLYFIHQAENAELRKKTLSLTTTLISTILFFSENKKIISGMARLNHEQIGLLEKWIKENAKETPFSEE